jgi:hypothetical protein
MLFAVWTENRATEEAERISVRTSSIRSLSLHELSRTNTTNITPVPPPETEIRPQSADSDMPVGDDALKDRKTVKFDVVDEERSIESSGWDDGRPPVFKSTFWEVCCILSIVCGQLTNVSLPTRSLGRLADG